MVEKIDQQDRADGDGLGGCHRVCAGGSLFCESVLLSELCDSFFVAGKIAVGR